MPEVQLSPRDLGSNIDEEGNLITTEQRDLIKSADVVQLLSGSSRPLDHWKTSQFYTDDGKFEKFILERLEPAVDGMTEDLQGKKNLN